MKIAVRRRDENGDSGAYAIAVDVYVEVRAGATAGADVYGSIFQLSLQSKS
jgi:hypothetical protein